MRQSQRGTDGMHAVVSACRAAQHAVCWCSAAAPRQQQLDGTVTSPLRSGSRQPGVPRVRLRGSGAVPYPGTLPLTKYNSASVKDSRGLKSPKLSLGWMLVPHPSGPNRYQALGFNVHLDNDGNLKICSFKNYDRRSFHLVWLQDLPARKQGELLVNCFWWGRKAQTGHPKCWAGKARVCFELPGVSALAAMSCSVLRARPVWSALIVRGRAAWGARGQLAAGERRRQGGGTKSHLLKYHKNSVKKKIAEESGVKKYCWMDPVYFSFLTQWRKRWQRSLTCDAEAIFNWKKFIKSSAKNYFCTIVLSPVAGGITKQLS